MNPHSLTSAFFLPLILVPQPPFNFLGRCAFAVKPVSIHPCDKRLTLFSIVL